MVLFDGNYSNNNIFIFHNFFHKLYIKSLRKTLYLQEVKNVVWKWKKITKISSCTKKMDFAEMDITFIKWNIDFGFRKLIEICEILWCEFLPWKLTLNFFHVIRKNRNCTFLDKFIISNIAIFTLLLGLYCDFHHVLRFLSVLSKNSCNLKNIKKMV